MYCLWVFLGNVHLRLLSGQLLGSNPAWVGPPPEAGRRLSARTRYRQLDAACAVQAAGSERLELAFGGPQWAVTPGQSAVPYDGEGCLGGGIIESSAQNSIPALPGTLPG